MTESPRSPSPFLSIGTGKKKDGAKKAFMRTLREATANHAAPPGNVLVKEEKSLHGSYTVRMPEEFESSSSSVISEASRDSLYYSAPNQVHQVVGSSSSDTTHVNSHSVHALEHTTPQQTSPQIAAEKSLILPKGTQPHRDLDQLMTMMPPKKKPLLSPVMSRNPTTPYIPTLQMLSPTTPSSSYTPSMPGLFSPTTPSAPHFGSGAPSMIGPTTPSGSSLSPRFNLSVNPGASQFSYTSSGASTGIESREHSINQYASLSPVTGIHHQSFSNRTDMVNQRYTQHPPGSHKEEVLPKAATMLERSYTERYYGLKKAQKQSLPVSQTTHQPIANLSAPSLQPPLSHFRESGISVASSLPSISTNRTSTVRQPTVRTPGFWSAYPSDTESDAGWEDLPPIPKENGVERNVKEVGEEEGFIAPVALAKSGVVQFGRGEVDLKADSGAKEIQEPTVAVVNDEPLSDIANKEKEFPQVTTDKVLLSPMTNTVKSVNNKELIFQNEEHATLTTEDPISFINQVGETDTKNDFISSLKSTRIEEQPPILDNLEFSNRQLFDSLERMLTPDITRQSHAENVNVSNLLSHLNDMTLSDPKFNTMSTDNLTLGRNSFPTVEASNGDVEVIAPVEQETPKPPPTTKSILRAPRPAQVIPQAAEPPQTTPKTLKRNSRRSIASISSLASHSQKRRKSGVIIKKRRSQHVPRVRNVRESVVRRLDGLMDSINRSSIFHGSMVTVDNEQEEDDDDMMWGMNQLMKAQEEEKMNSLQPGNLKGRNTLLKEMREVLWNPVGSDAEDLSTVGDEEMWFDMESEQHHEPDEEAEIDVNNDEFLKLLKSGKAEEVDVNDDEFLKVLKNGSARSSKKSTLASVVSRYTSPAPASPLRTVSESHDSESRDESLTINTEFAQHSSLSSPKSNSRQDSPRSAKTDLTGSFNRRYAIHVPPPTNNSHKRAVLEDVQFGEKSTLGHRRFSNEGPSEWVPEPNPLMINSWPSPSTPTQAQQYPEPSTPVVEIQQPNLTTPTTPTRQPFFTRLKEKVKNVMKPSSSASQPPTPVSPSATANEIFSPLKGKGKVPLPQTPNSLERSHTPPQLSLTGRSRSQVGYNKPPNMVRMNSLPRNIHHGMKEVVPWEYEGDDDVPPPPTIPHSFKMFERKE
ncbi:hypothetical protein HDV05_000080 [Chytridiales sp. JEL 0842]|nr:hypothetical protein HDV05_000080 [Chytridiales sp. JEL 0842]